MQRRRPRAGNVVFFATAKLFDRRRNGGNRRDDGRVMFSAVRRHVCTRVLIAVRWTATLFTYYISLEHAFHAAWTGGGTHTLFYIILWPKKKKKKKKIHPLVVCFNTFVYRHIRTSRPPRQIKSLPRSASYI